MGVPAKIAVIAKAEIKTDDRDSENLAHIYQVGFFPECYLPPMEIENLRLLIRHRMQLGKKVGAVKNQIHALISRNLLDDEFKKYSDIFGLRGMKKLSEIELPPYERKSLGRYLMELQVLLEQEEDMQEEFARIGQNNEEIKLLMTIPGISYYSAVALIAEIGDITRFPTKRHFGSYSGLVPKADNSGDKISKHRHVKKGNMVLKYFLVNTVLAMMRSKKDNSIKRFYRKKQKQIGTPKAQVAAARKLASVVWWVLTNKKPFKDEDQSLTQRKISMMNSKASVPEREITQEDIRELVNVLNQKQKILQRLNNEVDTG